MVSATVNPGLPDRVLAQRCSWKASCPYLAASQVRHLFATICSAFVDPPVICDLTTRTFARRYAGKIGKRFRELGAPYGRLEREPLELIRAAGYRLKTQESIVARAVSFGMLSIPGWLLATVLRSLRDGSTIANFELS